MLMRADGPSTPNVVVEAVTQSRSEHAVQDWERAEPHARERGTYSVKKQSAGTASSAC